MINYNICFFVATPSCTIKEQLNCRHTELPIAIKACWERCLCVGGLPTVIHAMSFVQRGLTPVLIGQYLMGIVTVAIEIQFEFELLFN